MKPFCFDNGYGLIQLVTNGGCDDRHKMLDHPILDGLLTPDILLFGYHVFSSMCLTISSSVIPWLAYSWTSITRALRFSSFSRCLIGQSALIPFAGIVSR